MSFKRRWSSENSKLGIMEGGASRTLDPLPERVAIPRVPFELDGGPPPMECHRVVTCPNAQIVGLLGLQAEDIRM
eukprot:1347353-Pyramimonas_sp.AAC.1